MDQRKSEPLKLTAFSQLLAASWHRHYRSTNEENYHVIRLFVFLQNRDGGWGLHIEGPSTMFGTVLNYVTLRLLGEGPEGGQGAVEKACEWILEHGSATAITSWGKMWLSVQILVFHCLLICLFIYY